MRRYCDIAKGSLTTAATIILKGQARMDNEKLITQPLLKHDSARGWSSGMLANWATLQNMRMDSRRSSKKEIANWLRPVDGPRREDWKVSLRSPLTVDLRGITSHGE